MTLLNQVRIGQLIERRSPLCASLFMPTFRSGRERQQDAIRLNNLVSEAKRRLNLATDSTKAVDALLQPAVELPSDEDFWRRRSDGLACFCAADFFQAYRVPFSLSEQLFVGERFYIRPLLPVLRFDARIYVLTLTQESAKLFEATKTSIREIKLPDLAPIEVDGDEQTLQYHSHQAPAQGKGDVKTAIYHGHGGPADRSKKDALRFFQLVDRAVSRTLRGQRAPLVLACVGYLAPLYESTNNYRNLFKAKVPGSPNRWSDEELRDHAWRLVEPHFRGKRKAAWAFFQQALGKKDGGSDDLRSVVLAADEGRVDTLFLARGTRRPDATFSPIDRWRSRQCR